MRCDASARRPVATRRRAMRRCSRPRTTTGASRGERFAVASLRRAAARRRCLRARHYRSSCSGSQPDGASVAALDPRASASVPHDGGRTAPIRPGPLSREDTPGRSSRSRPPTRARAGRTALRGSEHAHLLVFHPRDAKASALRRFAGCGLEHTGIVTLSQLVAFLSFQIRAVAWPARARPPESRRRRRERHDRHTLDHADQPTAPTAFTQARARLAAWLEPLAEEALTERQRAGLVDLAARQVPYFRLLARDPDILEARTRTDKDIFYNAARRPAARRAGACGRGRFARQWLHLLRLGACAFRDDVFEARRRCAAPARRRRRRPTSIRAGTR